MTVHSWHTVHISVYATYQLGFWNSSCSYWLPMIYVDILLGRVWIRICLIVSISEPNKNLFTAPVPNCSTTWELTVSPYQGTFKSMIFLIPRGEYVSSQVPGTSFIRYPSPSNVSDSLDVIHLCRWALERFASVEETQTGPELADTFGRYIRYHRPIDLLAGKKRNCIMKFS